MTADLNLRTATPTDRPAIERLWLMFKHDMSEFVGGVPNPDGAFRSERLEAAFSDSVDWAPYLISLSDRPVGFVFVRGLSRPTRVLNSFFVVRGVRRAGVGLWAVREVMARHPGEWEVAFQENNGRAVRFWRRVGEEFAPGAWTEERRPVPERPDLAPDCWISFRYPNP
ncbi:GNAT family N-acetyltransferase [Streptomyces canus]|uniref:Acetyltransferase n=1 Tax=Streptomyces canus TaxID=58343 RepID=A0AAW8FMF9_9ACTN|nr:GNAT family N-acetyltransferase [Streptomyces canus]MDQ0761138.1 putative acetyltransferase [Streptomyces canus]MDQ0910237.1 putative acetyltransferase [Streptomyces canus]MDQ1070237.1 putative acetyltransferase [Streptomyces canus]